MDAPDAEQLLASTVNFLIQGEEHEAATLLLFCAVEIETVYHTHPNGGLWYSYAVHLMGPRQAYAILSNSEHSVWYEVNSALRAVMPSQVTFDGWDIRAQLIDVEPSWREELRQIAAGRGVHNQAVEIPKREIVRWGNLGFRSESERRVAIALDTTGVLFLPK